MTASLFHICPAKLQGATLYPLGELDSLFPELATEARRKYTGREWLLNVNVPQLNCRWMDTVMFSPVDPKDVKDALLAAGHGRYPLRWIVVDAAELPLHRTCAFLPGESPENDAFIPLSSKLLATHSALSSAQRTAFFNGAPGRTLLFDRTLHVLHRGSVPFDSSRIITV